jgi:starch-binding outer membrane protein, SusD/RagB family
MLLNFFAQPYNYTPDASHPGIALFVTWDPLKEKTARSSVKDSYVSVINDLLSATALLGEAPFVKSAFTKWSAMAMLSRVYLYSGDYAKAKDYAVSVINEIPLMITGYPEKLFTAENTESIFELPPATNASLYGTSYASDLYRSDRFHATGDIADVLNEDLNDSRSAWISEQSGNWSVVKFPEDVVPDATSPQSAYFQPVLRSSELYLTASEAYQELDKTDSAIFYLDAIRMRANPLALPTISSGNGLKEGIRNERRKELAFEGHRMFDLQRWNQKVVRADVLQGSPSELPYPNDKAIAPISTLDVEGFGISQNAGY